MNWMKPVLAGAFLMGVAACGETQTETAKGNATQETAAEQPAQLVSYEKFELENGLNVVFHIDRSDPVVAVTLTAHVGSARETPGRTGFAHLFEHLLFLESENLGKGGLDQMSARIGGSGANGSTSRDITNYLQTVPKDALEKMIWAEADKLGWFINTVTEPVLAKEKQVVKNEKRQSYDNRPYGHTYYVISKNIFPEGHPYNWQVIGSLEDLQAATLDDVKTFFRRWYVPNNVTLSIAGDFDPAQAKAWVEKYFNEIPRGEEVERREAMQVNLAASKAVYYEDNFAKLPGIWMTWPVVPRYHSDEAALDVLFSYLTGGKASPFHKLVVDEKKLASGVSMSGYYSELAGTASLSTRAFEGTDLDTVKAAFDEAFALFEREGITQADIDRIKTDAEVNFYYGISSVLGKAVQLGRYDVLADDPGHFDTELEAIKSVTLDDVSRVYETYIKDKPVLVTSVVPKGQADLAVEGSELAEIVEEKIVQGAEETFDASQQATYEKTPSTFDRSVEPPYGEPPVPAVPEVWNAELSNGLKVIGMSNAELPLVQFNISIDGGALLDDPAKVGTANLMASVMNRGTENKSPEELQKAMMELGASIAFSAGADSIVLSGSTLARNLAPTLKLAEEMLLEPRWDESEFELAKLSILDGIRASKGNPNAIAVQAFNEVYYGKGHPFAADMRGTEESVNSITLDDLKAFYGANISPSEAMVHVAGDAAAADIEAGMSGIAARWQAKPVNVPTPAPAPDVAEARVYFYDVPGAKQSVLRLGHPLPNIYHADANTLGAMNFILGGGGFASRLTQELREGKGYTYGIRSSVSQDKVDGSLLIRSGVRSNVTLEAVALVKEIMEQYGNTFTEADLEMTKSFFSKSQARELETLGSKLGMLVHMAHYDLPADYPQQRLKEIEALTVADIKRLSDSYIRPDKMIYLVVGDAATQRDRLKELGFGDPIPLN